MLSQRCSVSLTLADTATKITADSESPHTVCYYCLIQIFAVSCTVRKLLRFFVFCVSGVAFRPSPLPNTYSVIYSALVGAIQHSTEPVPSPEKEEGWRQEGHLAIKEVCSRLLQTFP